MFKVLVALVLLYCCILLSFSKSVPTYQFWVDGEDGVDNSTCGGTASPCRTLRYLVTEIYENNNLSYVEINLLSNLLHEDCEIPHAFLSTVTIHINGNENTIKNSTISIPRVEFMHTWFDSSHVSGHIVGLSYCTLSQSLLFDESDPDESLQPELTLQGCDLTDTNTTFFNLHVNESIFFNSPLVTPLNGNCYITASQFTGTSGVTALTCGTSNINSCEFSGNQGVLGGAISIIQFGYIGYTSIFNNSANLGGGIYSQGYISLDHVQITGNVASQGGGLYFYGPLADIECVDTVLISNNKAEVGGGMAVNSQLFTSNTEAPEELCTMKANKATAGGAIYVSGSSASLIGFAISGNIATVGGAVYSVNSTFNVSQTNVEENAGIGVHFVDSVVVVTTSRFFNNSDIFGANVDVRLSNSSSYLTSWAHVTISNVGSFVCNDCNGKLCSAGTSCADCKHSCMEMGSRAVCLDDDFGCVHGNCEEMKDHTPICKCDNNYTGDLCEEHMPLPSQWENILFIALFGVGCLVTLFLVVAFIIRLHRHRSSYLPILK